MQHAPTTSFALISGRRPVVAIEQFLDLRLADRQRREHLPPAVLRGYVLRQNPSRVGIAHGGSSRSWHWPSQGNARLRRSVSPIDIKTSFTSRADPGPFSRRRQVMIQRWSPIKLRRLSFRPGPLCRPY